MHRTKVRVVEDALDANNTIAARQPRRLRPRRRDRRQPDERARGGQDDAARARCSRDGSTACASACSRATCRARMDADRLASAARAGHPAQHRPGLRRRVPPRRQHGALGARRRCRCDDIDLLVIENVGNLVCPAEFRVGEDARVMVSSVTEGEDKPLKYPLMFRTCELVLVNKIDLLPHLDFDLERFLHNLDAVHPGVERDARQRAHRRGRRRVRGLAGARWPRARGRPRDRRGLARRRARARRAPAGRAHRGQRALLRATEASGSRGSATGWPSASRAAGGWSRVGAPPPARSDVAPRRRRVRAPGDRRQARAAGDRAVAARRAAGRARLDLLAEPDDIVHRLRRPADGRARGGARARARARLPDGRLRAARRRVGVRAAERRPVRAPGAGRDALPRALGARARVLRAPRPARGPRRAARCTTPARRASSTRSWPSSENDLEAVLDDVRRVGADEGRRGRRAARADAGRGREALRAAAADAARGASTRGGTAAGARQRRLGHRRDGRRRRLRAPPPPRLAGAPRARPHRGHGDPHRDRQRHRRRGDLRAPGDRLRRARATRCSRSPRAATRAT